MVAPCMPSRKRGYSAPSRPRRPLPHSVAVALRAADTPQMIAATAMLAMTQAWLGTALVVGGLVIVLVLCLGFSFALGGLLGFGQRDHLQIGFTFGGKGMQDRSLVVGEDKIASRGGFVDGMLCHDFLRLTSHTCAGRRQHSTSA